MAYAAMQHDAYGTTALEAGHNPFASPDHIVKPNRFLRQRMTMNINAIFVSLFVPWLLFTLLHADTSFRLHYKHPALCWCLVALGALFTVTIIAFAGSNATQGWHSHPSYRPTWYIFLSLTCLVATILGPALGNMNFWANMQPYYDLQNLNDYSAVDPTRMRGQQMMDAGRVQFTKGAALDLRKAYAFQNLDTYCVAPITMFNPQLGSPTPLTSYDFWAVGINCCGGNSTNAVDFKCGAYKQGGEGLRLMANEERAFFRLAVQQAESANKIKAVHPLFFYWSDDAVTDMHGYLESGFRNFAICMCVAFAIQLVLVSILSYVLSKTGHSNL